MGGGGGGREWRPPKYWRSMGQDWTSVVTVQPGGLGMEVMRPGLGIGPVQTDSTPKDAAVL